MTARPAAGRKAVAGIPAGSAAQLSSCTTHAAHRSLESASPICTPGKVIGGCSLPGQEADSVGSAFALDRSAATCSRP